MNPESAKLARVVQRPWFDRRPRRAIVIASALFVAVFVLRISVGDERDAIAMLYVLPISLIAISFGQRAGVVAGGTGVGLLATWTLVSEVSLTPLGWLSRIVPLVLIGGLIGSASDRMRAADAAERRADAIALLQRDGAEINDSIVQNLAAAKWAIESADVERARSILDDTIVTGQKLVTRVLGSESPVHDQIRRSRRHVRPSTGSNDQQS
jgi:glucose-6-phosphate-specific signal transduction histidine kinase